MSTRIFSVEMFRTNLALQLRMMQLMHECGERWLESAKQRNGEALASTVNELEELPQVADLQTFLSKRTETMGRLMQAYMGTSQSLADTMLKDQAAWMAGMQQALKNWQTEVNEQLGRSNSASGNHGVVLTGEHSKPTQN